MRQSWSIATCGSVPSDIDRYLREEVISVRRMSKFFKRWLFLLITGQRFLLKEKFPLSQPNRKPKILWISLSAPSIGDSVTDLAGRCLLGDFEVDLFTHEKNHTLYLRDEFFGNVVSSVRSARVLAMEKR